MLYFSGTRKPNFPNIKKVDYNSYWHERGFSINKKLKEREYIFLNHVPIGARILDIGCGNSRLPLALKEKGCDIHVSDISPIVLKGYSNYGISSFSFDLNSLSEQLSLGKYDYIILSEVLEHMQNPEEILKSLSFHTAFFFITIPNSAFYRYRFHLFFKGRFFTQWVYHPSEHLRYWSHIDFLDWLEALGFEIVITQASNGFSLFKLPLFKWFPNLFGHQICYFVKVV